MISQRTLFLTYQAQTSSAPMMLEIIKARGIILTDYKGKRYMDLISGIAVSNLGHAYPSVNRAIQKQLRQYTHLMVYGEIIQSPQVQLSQLLCAQLPPSLQSVYYVSSGSEAIEGALKLAKRVTNRREIAAFEFAYHGSTHGALSIQGSETYKQAFRPLLPGYRMLRFNNQEDLSNITEDTACVVVEPVQGEAGCLPADIAWLKALRARCDKTGALLIFDEVQTGYGRTGSMFTFQQYDVLPDILVLAKGFGGGLPLGAFISSKSNMALLAKNPVLGHITTFGGHPLCCAASLQTLKELLSQDYIQSVEEKANLFREELNHPAIICISGKGLMLGVEFESAELNKRIIAQCMQNGLLTDWFLFNDKKLRLTPPLIITHKQIKQACRLLKKSIDEVLTIR
ncbi:MAG: aspartate aminotransferase family protein [Flavobacteriales bacterium]|nr:aspartate aminotransferase family protein [Flavobacteriales bacterium]